LKGLKKAIWLIHFAKKELKRTKNGIQAGKKSRTEKLRENYTAPASAARD
jgi:hypothetical protein